MVANKKQRSALRKNFKIYGLYFVFAIIYLVLTWITPANHNPLIANFHLSATALHFLSLTVALPIIIIWLAAFYGYDRLQTYASLVKNSKDGIRITKLARGLGVLAFSLPASSILGGILTYIGEKWLSLLPSMTIATRYVGLVLPLVAFWLVAEATWIMMVSVRGNLSFLMLQLFILAVVLLGIAYCYLAFDTTFPGGTGPRIYYLSNWLVVFTIVIPYVFMWTLGALSALGIYIYEKRLSGILYRRNWNFIASGVATIVAAEIAAQYLGTLLAQLSHIHIVTLLLIIYGLLAVIAIGFILIAIGANRLKKIEEV